MAGYRPKSLDELNNMYDKTMAAEKAIRKGTSLLEKSEESINLNTQLFEQAQPLDGETKQSQELSDAVNEFIAKYSQDTVSAPKKEDAVRPKPQMTILTPEQPKEEKIPEHTEEKKESAEENLLSERESVKTDRSDLMDEYIRIMTDEDDEIPQKKLSRKEKKKLKKKEKQEAAKAADEDIQHSEVNAEQETVQEAFEAPEYKILYSDEEESQTEEQSDADASAEEQDDFSFPENYTPEWIEKDEAAEKKEEPKKKDKKKNAKHTALKVLLSLILVLLVAVGGLATAFKSVLWVNTGKAFNDNYYVFTAEKAYENLSIAEGDLIITEKIYAEDGDIFAYIDYSERTFEFGKRSDSITNDDGEVLIVAEKEGSRTLVSRDDCKGVVYKIYPTVGKYVGLVTDNYIVVIAAVAILALIIILVLSLALRNKNEKKSESYKEKAQESAEESEEEDENLFATIE